MEISAENAPEQLHAGRAVRQCVKNTPNYSHTHKGITSAQSAKSKSSSTTLARTLTLNQIHPCSSASLDVSPFETEMKDAPPKPADEPVFKEQKVASEDQKMSYPDPKNKLAGKRSYEEICRSYESMFAFDWDLRDINNLRHPPGK